MQGKHELPESAGFETGLDNVKSCHLCGYEQQFFPVGQGGSDGVHNGLGLPRAGRSLDGDIPTISNVDDDAELRRIGICYYRRNLRFDLRIVNFILLPERGGTIAGTGTSKKGTYDLVSTEICFFCIEI